MKLQGVFFGKIFSKEEPFSQRNLYSSIFNTNPSYQWESFLVANGSSVYVRYIIVLNYSNNVGNT